MQGKLLVCEMDAPIVEVLKQKLSTDLRVQTVEKAENLLALLKQPEASDMPLLVLGPASVLSIAWIQKCLVLSPLIQIVILSPPPEMAALKQRLLFTPFLKSQVCCWSIEALEALPEMLQQVFDTICQQYRHRQVLKASQHRLQAMAQEKNQLSDLRRARQEILLLQHEHQKISEWDQMKTQILGHISHEMRSPLNAILGLSDILLYYAQQAEREDEIKLLNTIHQAGKHLLGLTQDIVNFSKIMANKIELYFQDIDMMVFLAEIGDMVQPLALQKQNQFQLEIPIPLNTCRLDPLRVRQILLNLLSNAFKFTRQGHVMLRATEADGTLCFTVKDTGIGMQASELEQIFEPFIQGGEANQKIEGTGLGLAISREMVNLMQGQLTVESVYGEGSTFCLFLPCQPQE